MEITDPRFRIAASRRMLYREGCDSGVAGHVSERGADGESFWVSAFGYFDETTPDTVLRYSFDLDLLDGEAPASPAVEFHAAVFRERPDVQSVIHTHSHYVMVFAALERELGMYNDAACLFYGQQVLYADDGTRPPVEGKRVAAELGDKSALWMKNHGFLVASPSLEEATVMAILAEKMARVHLDAAAAGAVQHAEAYVKAGAAPHRKYYIPQTWEANLRRLRKTDPDLFEYLQG